jgi:hypothetical protein
MGCVQLLQLPITTLPRAEAATLPFSAAVQAATQQQQNWQLSL